MSQSSLIILVVVLETMVGLGVSTLIALIWGPPLTDATAFGMALVVIAVLLCASGVGLVFALPPLLLSLILRLVFPQGYISFHYALGLISD